MILFLRVLVFFFFFSSRRRHTRWPRDWSSDCALPIYPRVAPSEIRRQSGRAGDLWLPARLAVHALLPVPVPTRRAQQRQARGRPMGQRTAPHRSEIGRASCRERVGTEVGGVAWREEGT